MALGLHVRAHHAIAHHRLTVFGKEGGNDGVERSLTWRHQIGRVRATCASRESVSSVLQADAELRLNTARTKAHVIALDEAHHHAVFIRSSEINRAALGRVAGFEILRLLHVDQTSALLQVSGVQHLLGCDFHAGLVGHIAVDIGKRQLHGFNLQMLRVHAVAA